MVRLESWIVVSTQFLDAKLDQIVNMNQIILFFKIL